MSICKLGMDAKIKNSSIRISVPVSHPLIKLANNICWKDITWAVLPDLKNSTTKLKWWLGRKLKLRIHLGAYLLQQLLNATDRGVERQIKDNAVYQVFCGKTVVNRWHCPDHTKIEEFRSRLLPETQCQLANLIAVAAVKYGFANPADLDIDSTVQEANISYPAHSSMLVLK